MADVSGIALAMVATVLALDAGHDHRVTIDHHRGAIDAEYRSRVAVTHRQMGAVTPGGVPSTLRCAWRAHLVVDRAARHGRAAVLSRTFRHDDVLAGSRAGWCAGAAPAIAREVAARDTALREGLRQAAERDRAAVVAELEQLHAQAGRG